MKIKLLVAFVFVILFLQTISAESSFNVQTSIFNKEEAKAFDSLLCKEGKDFLVQIAPFGCEPAVVRTDLLEENDVQVYCKLGATQINPLIDVQTIDDISFSEAYSPAVSGIGFHAAKAALGIKGDLNSPVLNNIGYVVINLKKQPNASAIPDFVEGNLTAKIKYNIKHAFGIGNAQFYLPELSQSDWETKRYQYNFWNGKGTLKAEQIGIDNAQISVYADEQRISNINLQKGETSNMIYLPGFECQAGLKLKLDGLENPNTRARLRINAEVVEIAECNRNLLSTQCEKFLDNKCWIKNLKYQGINQKVTIKCIEDDKTSEYDLSINPKIILNINGEDKEYSVGDRLYTVSDGFSPGSVYLGYVGTNGESRSVKDLFIYLVFLPQATKLQLSEEELSSVNGVVGDFKQAGITSSGVIDKTNEYITSIGAGLTTFSRAITTGEQYGRLNFKDGPMKILGTPISIIDFAGAQDIGLMGDAIEYYEKSKADYETIRTSYSSEISTKDATITFGEEAFYQEILLAWKSKQRKTAYDLCQEFIQAYPNSKKDISSYCGDAIKIANQNVHETYVKVNGEIKTISFDGIDEPTFEEYGAIIRVNTPEGKIKTFYLRKNEIVYLDERKEIGDFIQLTSLDDNSATIRTSLSVYGLSESISQGLSGGVITFTKDVPRDLGQKYVFTLTDINLKKIAKVSLIPNINDAGTEANFSFKIGIEKRAINLPPERVREIITSLNKTIGEWGDISGTLGNVTKGLQTGCLAAGTALVIKNFLSGTGGAGIARQTVMRGSNGWTEKCTTLVAQKNYSSMDKCFSENANAIDRDVEAVSRIIEEQNNGIKQLETGITTTQFLSDSIVDTNAFMEKYTPEVRECLGNQNYADPSRKGETISNEDLGAISYENWKNNKYFSKEQLRDIELYCNILKSSTASTELKQIANQRIYSDLLDIKTNSGNIVERNNLANQLGIASNDITFIETGVNVRKFTYEGLTNGNKIPGIDSTAPIAIISTSNGQKYILLLDNSVGTQQLPVKGAYNLAGSPIEIPAELKNIYFQKFDTSSYKNSYKNAELRYYETEPYKGLPAIVPFDLANGWYAATKQTLPVGGGIQPIDASARVNSFYLCNVGQNGIEEFQTIGDEICEMINLGTGMPYDVFPYLSDTEVKRLVDKAVKAITEASRLYQPGLSGKVIILGNSVKVGSPATDIPQFQCQDFMSPNECLLLFNLCDPVICPSSRCDLGGAYPVKDVVQTGIIGSLVLCLPNIQEGIIFPVCLTGVKAGIDGLLSVLTATRDCFQENLNTGKVVGICDEIYSFYLCDFFWKQALPLTDIVIPKVVEFLLGQNVRGGGEYASVQNSWNLAEKSINYFTNYYGANVKEAFLARTTESVKSEICKSWVSAVVPTGADFINQITTPASPAQFTGRFDESVLTSATVPPTSHYKVFYHIFAGTDSGAYYQVYLKGTASSYYKDTSQSLAIASGYIAVGGYASETKDPIASSGYNQMCINVNGQEECGFKEVSTDFAINYVKDKYLASQASETDITTEAGCISGSASLYSVLNPNVQSAAEEITNPAIYDRGIIRKCATHNPGLGTDPYAYVGTQVTGSVIAGITGKTGAIDEEDTPAEEDKPQEEEKQPEEEKPIDDKKVIEELTKNPGVQKGPRWVAVGYCDNEQIKCWLDTQSVKDMIKTTTVEGEALDEVTESYIDILRNEENYISEKEFSSAIQEIEKETNSTKKLALIEPLFDRAFWSKEKVQLFYLRGNAYAELLRVFLSKQIKPSEIVIESATSKDFIEAQKKLLDAAQRLENTIIPKAWARTCATAANYVYSVANVKRSVNAFYADSAGTKYTLSNGRTLTIGFDKQLDGKAAWAAQPAPSVKKISKEDKLAKLQPGYLIAYVWSAAPVASTQVDEKTWKDYDHMAIFIGWKNYEKKIAILFDWNGMTYNKKGNLVWGLTNGEKDKNGKICTDADLYTNPAKTSTPTCPVFRYYELVDLSDNKHPVYGYYGPEGIEPEIKTSLPTSKVDDSVGIPEEDPSKKILEDPTIAEEPTSTSTATADNPVYPTSSKIYSEATNLVGTAQTPLSLVTGALGNSKTISSIPTTLNELISALDKDKNFMEVDVKNLQKGDVILLGKGCNLDSVGIFSSYSSDKKEISYYTSTTGQASEIKTSFVTEIDFNIFLWKYVYRAYRYVGDMSDVEKSSIVKARTRWDLPTAIGYLGGYSQTGSIPVGDYSKNKVFSDQLVFDGVLDYYECFDLTGGAWGIGKKDMNWLKNLLLGKQLSLGIQSENIGGD